MVEVLALGWLPLLSCGLSILVGTILQRLAGQGLGLIAAPILVLAAPDFMPTGLLILGLVVGLGSVAVDRSAIAVRELPWGYAGRAVGSLAGAFIATRLVGTQGVSVIVAISVYLAIALSVAGLRVEVRPLSLVIAGITAGLMVTLTAIGGPPLALLYQHENQRRSAAMQNAFAFGGMIVAIGSLALFGLIGWRHLWFALAMLPFVLGGMWLAQRMAGQVAKRQIRPYALTLAGAAATVLLVRAVT